MAVGTVTIGETPCCGVIERTYEATPDQISPTGYKHAYNSAQLVEGEYQEFQTWDVYAPDFSGIARFIDRGICPDCKQRFR